MKTSPALRALSALLIAPLVACGSGERDAAPDPTLDHLEPQVVEAIGRARHAALEHPDSAEAWGELAATYDAHLLADLAEDGYRRARRLAPEDFRWVYLLAIVREINGADADELAELFGRAQELRPNYEPAWLRLGDALWRRGRHDAARGELEHALALAPDDALAHRRLGQVLLTQGHAAEAVPHLERAIELEPRDLAAYGALAQAQARLGDESASRETVARSQGLEPVQAIDDPVHAAEVVSRNVGSDHLFGSAVQRIRRGEFEAAIEALEVVVAASPRDPSARYWLGTAYRRAGRAQPAEESLARAIELEPRMNVARLELADLLAEQGRTAEAAVRYREAMQFAPNDASIAERLERVERR